jgi:hypothetical protein
MVFDVAKKRQTRMLELGKTFVAGRVGSAHAVFIRHIPSVHRIRPPQTSSNQNPYVIPACKIVGQERTTPIRQDRKEIPRRIDFRSPIIRHDQNYIQLSKEHKIIKNSAWAEPTLQKNCPTCPALRVGLWGMNFSRNNS